MLIYRLILAICLPVLILRLWLRDSPRDRAERLARTTGPSGAVWLHAASNGELTSARALIEALAERHPLLITCNNPTGRDLVESWGLQGVAALLAPLDLRHTVDRFLDCHDPKVLIVIENELWPNRIDGMARRGKPVIIVSARLSASSARNWHRLGGLARCVLGGITLLSAQDEGSERRFRELGLSDDKIAPRLNLKTTLEPDPPDSHELAALQPLLPRDKTLLAASTHESEDEIVLGGFALALDKDPDLRLILAPRHPKRRAALVQLLSKTKLSYAARSTVPRPAADTQVFLADTLGEMPLWYALAGTVFVGGSLVDRGGHTPFEPAAFSCALLHGPHLDNFQEAYDLLQENDASTLVTTPSDIAKVLCTPLEQRKQQGKMAQRLLARHDAVDQLKALQSRIESQFSA